MRREKALLFNRIRCSWQGFTIESYDIWILYLSLQLPVPRVLLVSSSDVPAWVSPHPLATDKQEKRLLRSVNARRNDSAPFRDMTTHIALWREFPWHVRIVYISDWIFQSKWKSIFPHRSTIRRLIYILIEKSEQMLCGLWNLNNSVRHDGGLAGHWNGINGMESIDYAMTQLAWRN